MKRRVIQTFLVVAISLIIPICQAYSLYYILSEADFISLDLKFENIDQEILPITKQNDSGIFLSSASSIILPPEIMLFEDFRCSSFIPSPLGQKAIILRC